MVLAVFLPPEIGAEQIRVALSFDIESWFSGPSSLAFLFIPSSTSVIIFAIGAYKYY